MLPRVDKSGIRFRKRRLTNFFIRAAFKARMPFANLFQRGGTC